MRKYLFCLLLLFAVSACKKTEFSPEGPTDVRVRNISDQTLNEVIVNIDGEKDTLGTIASGGTSGYYRFKIAYSKAEIYAKINEVIFSTGPVDYTYLDFKGRMRITYVVWISDWNKKKLEIKDVIPEEPLTLK